MGVRLDLVKNGNTDLEFIGYGLATGIIFVLPVALVAGGIADGVNIAKKNEMITESYQYLSEQTSETFNIEDFKAYEGRIELEDGSQYKLFMSGSSKDKFVKLSADISIEDANEIILLSKQLEDSRKSYNDANGIYYNPFNKNLSSFKKQNVEIYSELINAFSTAIKNSSNQKLEVAIDEKLLNDSIETNSLDSIKDLQVLDISNVEQQKDNQNLYYFFIDTLVYNKNKELSKQTFKVEVEGNNLSQNEVYAKFISGNYKIMQAIDEPANGTNENEIGLTR